MIWPRYSTVHHRLGGLSPMPSAIPAPTAMWHSVHGGLPRTTTHATGAKGLGKRRDAADGIRLAIRLGRRACRFRVKAHRTSLPSAHPGRPLLSRACDCLPMRARRCIMERRTGVAGCTHSTSLCMPRGARKPCPRDAQIEIDTDSGLLEIIKPQKLLF
jgi:hypothetical protein